MPEIVIGVDGGNSKTDVAVATVSGRILARFRGPGVRSPLHDPAGWRRGLLATVERAVDQAREQTRVSSPAACVAYFLANVDLPVEQRVARRELVAAGTAATTLVHNDCLAVLRAGATRSWGVAVVVGAGMNAIGVHPSGRAAGFLALGEISGDRFGGRELGVSGLGAAARAQDGRGPGTGLVAAVPAHFGLRRPSDVAIAVHEGRIRADRLLELAPLVLAAAAQGDAVASGLISGLADEIVVMTTTLLRRLHLLRSDAEVVLGGGVLQGALQRDDGAPTSGLVERATADILQVAPQARVGVLDAPPVFGALVTALCEVGAGPAALRRARREIWA
jgi:N-acetylglucosamine kinase-like BadF-type ATPase